MFCQGHYKVTLMLRQGHYKVTLMLHHGLYKVKLMLHLGHYKVTLRLHQGHYQVTLMLRQGHYKVTLMLHQGHYRVTLHEDGVVWNIPYSDRDGLMLTWHDSVHVSCTSSSSTWLPHLLPWQRNAPSGRSIKQLVSEVDH